jgi:hypothetical protein
MKLAFLLMSFLSTFAFSQTATGHYYLMSYFKNDYPGTGDMAGGFFATSTDGITWVELNNAKPILIPQTGPNVEGRMRDPYLYFDPMTQVFHLVYTTGWNTLNVGYTSIVPTDGKKFTDPNSWAPQTLIWFKDSIPNVNCCWAPEIIYDDIQQEYMLYLSIDVGVNGKQSYYYMTKDFISFTKGKNTAVAATSPMYGTPKFFDPGFTEIDGDMLKVANGNYRFFFKDERTGYKRIYSVTGPTPQGPWSPDSSPFLGTINGNMTGVEGPSSIKMGNQYRVYFDPYSARQNYRMVSSTDLTTWVDSSSRGLMIRSTIDTTTYFDYSHCNVLEIPQNIYNWIMSSSGKLAVKQNLKSLSPLYSGGARFTTSGIYDIMGKKLVNNFTLPSQNATMLPAGFYVTVGKDKKVVKDLQIQK